MGVPSFFLQHLCLLWPPGDAKKLQLLLSFLMDISCHRFILDEVMHGNESKLHDIAAKLLG